MFSLQGADSIENVFNLFFVYFFQIVYYASILAGKIDSPKLREEDADPESMLEDDSLLIYPGSKKASSPEFTDALAEELQVNVLDCRRPFIPFEEFYNEPLSDAIEMDNDYLYYKNRQGGKCIACIAFHLTSFNSQKQIVYISS